MDQGFNHAPIQIQASPKQAMSNQMTQQKKKKPWWTSLISEAGGAGGLAAGAALAPETGGLSLLIPAAGAALGAFGGRVAENEVRDNRVGLGDAAKEGVTSGVLSGVAGGYNAYKGAKAAKGVATVAEGLDNPQDLIKAPQKIGLLQSVGQSLKRGAGNYGTGAKVSGQQQLTASGSDAVDQTLKTLKVPATAPETQARILDNHLSNLGSILSKRYSQANVPISTQEINNLGSNIIGRVANTAGLSGSAKQFALDEAQKLVKNGTDLNSVWNYTKDLARNSTNFSAGGSAKLADKEGAARIILDEARGFLNGKVPGLADTNNLYHGAKTAESFILDAARDKGGGLIQRIASSSPAKTLEAKGGSLLESVGKLSAGTGGNASQFTNALKIQSPGSLLRGASGIGQQGQSVQPATDPQSLMNQSQTSQDQTSNLLGQTNGGGDVTSQLLGQPQQAQSAGGPSLSSLQQAIQQDIQTTGGKNISDIMQLGQLYGIVDSSGSPVTASTGSSNIGKISAQQNGLAKSGVQSLQQLSQLIQSDPTILEKNATPGQGTPLIGSLISNAAGASNYHSLADNILSSLIHLQTGATATKEEITSAHGQLPQPNDPPDVQQRKLQTLLSNFSPFLGN